MITLHLLPLSLAFEQERHLRTLIPPLELQHWQRRRQHGDQLRSILAHGALRLLLAEQLCCPVTELRFGLLRHGKPILLQPSDAWHFNISHSAQWVAIAMAPYPVGVDIERHSGAAAPDLLESCFTAAERSRITSEADFYQAWCAKEAALKAAGCGFSIAPTELELVPSTATQATVRSPHPNLHGLHVDSRLWDQDYRLAWSSATKPNQVTCQENRLPGLKNI